MPTVPAHTVYEDPANFVRLELDHEIADESASAYSHPVRLTERQMREILEGLLVRERQTFLEGLFLDAPQKEPAFDPDEVAFLAPRLVDALAEANPEERVTFYLSRPQSSIKREVTSGGLYVRDDHLHLVLGNHHADYGIPTYGMVYDREHPTMPISPKGFDLLFEPHEAVVEQGSGMWESLLGRDADEVVIDLTDLFPSSDRASLCPPRNRSEAGNGGISCL